MSEVFRAMETPLFSDQKKTLIILCQIYFTASVWFLESCPKTNYMGIYLKESENKRGDEASHCIHSQWPQLLKNYVLKAKPSYSKQITLVL